MHDAMSARRQMRAIVVIFTRGEQVHRNQPIWAQAGTDGAVPDRKNHVQREPLAFMPAPSCQRGVPLGLVEDRKPLRAECFSRDQRSEPGI